MIKGDFLHHWQRLGALLPFYGQDGGNYTRVFLEGGDALVEEARVDTVRRTLARRLQVDENSARQEAARLLMRQRLLPLAYHEKLVLVPLSFRRVKVKDDGGTGYVNLLQVASCRRSKGACLSELVLKDGSVLPCLNTRARVLVALQEGRAVLEEYLKLKGGDKEGKGLAFLKWLAERHAEYLG